MKIFRVIAQSVGALLVLLVGGVLALALLVDANDYKAKIGAAVAAKTGMELTWYGDIELAFVPWLGLKTGGVALANRDDDAPMLAVDAAEIRVQLLPLLRARVEVDSVRLRKPRARLIRRADGVANWDELAGRVAGTKSSPDAALLAGLVVQGVSVSDGEVEWRDDASGESLSLRAVNLSAAKLTPGAKVSLSASLVATANSFAERVHINMSGDAQLSRDAETVALLDAEIAVATPGFDAAMTAKKITYAVRSGRAEVSGLIGDAERNGVAAEWRIPAITYDRNAGLQIPHAEFEQGDFAVTGAVASAIGQTINLTGDAKINAVSIADLLERNGFDPDLAGADVDDLDATFDFVLTDKRAEIKKLAANFLLNREATKLSVPTLTYAASDDAINLPALQLSQDDFSLIGSLRAMQLFADLSKRNAIGELDARSDDFHALLQRNGLEVAASLGMPDSLAAGFHFEFVGNELIVRDLAVASLDDDDGELLFERKKIVVPVTTDGALAFDLVVAGIVREQAERALSKFLRGQIVVGDKEQISRQWKEKIGGMVREVLEGE